MIKRFVGKISVILLLFFTSNCATKIKDFQLYQKSSLNKSFFLPNKKQFNKSKLKVVVFDLNENDNNHAISANLGQVVASEIRAILSQNQLVELIDRNAAEKLKNEIQLAEINKSGAFKGHVVANYIVSGDITNAAFNSKYKKGGVFYSKEHGLIKFPAKFSYYSNVGLDIKINSIPSLDVKKNFSVSASATRSEDASSEGILNLIVGGKTENTVKKDDALAALAAKRALAKIANKIKDFFAPEGYVLEKRKLEKKEIYKISLGFNDGIKQNDSLKIIGKYRSQNPITGDIEIEERIIASGKVSDVINSNSAWVKLKIVNQIRLGDRVKIDYETKSFF